MFKQNPSAGQKCHYGRKVARILILSPIFLEKLSGHYKVKSTTSIQRWWEKNEIRKKFLTEKGTKECPSSLLLCIISFVWNILKGRNIFLISSHSLVTYRNSASFFPCPVFLLYLYMEHISNSVLHQLLLSL